MKPRVSVIIPTYRHWPELTRCLKALEQQTLPAEAFEVLVVNNDPADPPPAALEVPAGVRLLTEAAPGSYAARNRALREAAADVLAFTDADCIPDPRWLSTALEHIEGGAVRIAGAVTLTFDTARLNAAECFEKAYSFRQADNAHRGVSVTANLIATRGVFARVGAFKGTLMSGGDFEWNLRANNAGVPLAFVPACEVQHPARTQLRELLEKHRRIAGTDPKHYGKGWRALCFGMVPSLHALRQVWREPALSPREKTLAFSMHYLLKLYRTWVHLCVRLRLTPPSRR